MIWIILIEAVFWVLHYASTRNLKFDVELWNEEL